MVGTVSRLSAISFRALLVGDYNIHWHLQDNIVTENSRPGNSDGRETWQNSTKYIFPRLEYWNSMSLTLTLGKICLLRIPSPPSRAVKIFISWHKVIKIEGGGEILKHRVFFRETKSVLILEILHTRDISIGKSKTFWYCFRKCICCETYFFLSCV